MQTSVLAPGTTSSAPAAVAAPASALTRTPLPELVDAYMKAYAGRDRTRVTHLAWWAAFFGARAFVEITDDDVHAGLEQLRSEPPMHYMGRDEHGRKIAHWKRNPKSPATINRYHTALMALFTWAIKRDERRAGGKTPRA
jgi:hypothetical protein